MQGTRARAHIKGKAESELGRIEIELKHVDCNDIGA